MSILNVLLVILVLYVLYTVGTSVYRTYTVYRMNQAIVALYSDISFLTRQECDEANDLLDEAERIGANQRTVDTARRLVKVQIDILEGRFP